MAFLLFGAAAALACFAAAQAQGGFLAETGSYVSSDASNSGNSSGYAGFVVAGRRFSFIVKPQTGILYATGSNRYGQLGVGGAGDVLAPEPVDLTAAIGGGAISDWVVSAAAGAFHSLFLTEDGYVFAAGRNRYGEFGDGTTNPSDVPVQVHRGVKAVAAGYGHSLFLLESGAVEAAGWNLYGQLGDGGRVSKSTPVTAFSASSPVTAIAAGYDFSYFLTADGNVFACGQNLGGQLGDGTRVMQARPVQVSIAGVTGIAAGEAHGLFLKDGKVFGTGSNANGQLGDGANAGQVVDVPTEASALNVDVRAVFAGVDCSCTTTTDVSALYCMGSDLDGQLGLGDAGSSWRQPPQQVSGLYAYDVAMGYSHSLVLQADFSDVWSSGANAYGQLGDGTTASRTEFERLFLDITTTVTIPATGQPTPAPTPSAGTPSPTPPSPPTPTVDTTAAPAPEPTPAPTPVTAAPTPAPTPSETTRGISTPDFDFDWPTMIGVFVIVFGAALCLFALMMRVCGRDVTEVFEARDSDENAPVNHLELVSPGPR